MQCIIRLDTLFSVETASGQDITPRGARSKALLSLLALNKNGAITRTALQDKLWSTRAPQQAQASLRQELSRLRRYFQTQNVAPLIVDGDIVRLDRAEVGVHLRQPDRDTVETGFLDNVDVADEEFEDWIRNIRQIWREGKAHTLLPREADEQSPARVSAPETIQQPPEKQGHALVLGSMGCASSLNLSPVAMSLLQNNLSGLLHEAGFDVYTDARSNLHPQAETQILDAIFFADTKAQALFTLKSAANSQVIWNRTFPLLEDDECSQVLHLSQEVANEIVKLVFASNWSRINSWTGISNIIRQEYMTGKRLEFCGIKAMESRAALHFAKCLTIDDDFLPAHIALGFCEIDRIRFGETSSINRSLDTVNKHYAKAKDLDGEGFWTNCLGAYMDFFAGDTVNSVERLNQLIRNEKYDPEKITYYASLLGHTGDLERQLKTYNSIEGRGHDTPGWVRRGKALASVITNADGAEQALSQALREDGLTDANLVAMILFHLRAGDSKRVQDAIQKLLENTPDFDGRTWASRFKWGNADLYDTISHELKRAGL